MKNRYLIQRRADPHADLWETVARADKGSVALSVARLLNRDDGLAYRVADRKARDVAAAYPADGGPPF